MMKAHSNPNVVQQNYRKDLCLFVTTFSSQLSLVLKKSLLIDLIMLTNNLFTVLGNEVMMLESLVDVQVNKEKIFLLSWMETF